MQYELWSACQWHCRGWQRSESEDEIRAKMHRWKNHNLAAATRNVKQRGKSNAFTNKLFIQDVMQILRTFTTRPGMCRNFQYKFEVNSSLPVNYISRPVPFAFRSSVRTQIKQVLKDTANATYMNPPTTVLRFWQDKDMKRIVIILHEWIAVVNSEARVSIVPHTWQRNFQILNLKLYDKPCQNIEAVDPCLLYVYVLVLNKTLKRLINKYLYIHVNIVMFLRYNPLKSVSW
jgi:hypothetical protein